MEVKLVAVTRQIQIRRQNIVRICR